MWIACFVTAHGPPVPRNRCAKSRPGADGRPHPGPRSTRPAVGSLAATADLEANASESLFQFFQFSFIVISFRFSFSVSGLISLITVCFLIFIFHFLVPFKTFLVYLVHVLDSTGSLSVRFPVQIIYRILSYIQKDSKTIKPCSRLSTVRG